MPRYIDADALIIEIDMSEEISAYDAIVFEEMVNKQPTADVVEVVRCKNCKYYLRSNEKCELLDTRLHFYETDNTWTEDAFCAWGERREDEQIH